ncbi:MAG: tetratricopeptide repeat protein [Phycisphaerales bacterium]|nr:tetratricopeptide repeat protein [Phycisphaerales bacterium]
MPVRSGSKKLSLSQAAEVYQKGLAAYETGRYFEAIELLSSIDETDTLSGTLARYYLGQAHLHYGMSELRAGRHASAANHFSAARELNPNTAGLSRYIAGCYAGQGRFDLTVAEIERERDADHADADLPIRLAHAFARDGQRSRAVETLVEIIDSEPHRVDVRLQLGLIYASAEEFEDAICVLQEAAELAPLNAAIQQHLGLALAAAGDHDQAIEHLSVAQKLQPNDAYLALLLTLAIDAARTTCIKLAIDPETSQLETVDDRSLEILGELITEDPDFVDAFLSLPTSDVDSEIFAALSKILERALERHPDYADLYHHCARVHQRLGLTESAIIQARMAVQINPRYVQALIQLGRLYAETERTGEAIGRLKEAIGCGGDYPDVHYLLGELYRKKGHSDSAGLEYRRALELNSNFTRAHKALEMVLDS